MFTAPTREQLFVLRHITGIDELAGHNRFADATPDMVQAIVEGVGDFAENEFAPLNRIGDTVGAKTGINRYESVQKTMFTAWVPGFNNEIV